MRSIPASILSCSTSFRAWAILLVVDILIHQNTPTQEKTDEGETEGESKKMFAMQTMMYDFIKYAGTPQVDMQGAGGDAWLLKTDLGTLFDMYRHVFITF